MSFDRNPAQGGIVIHTFEDPLDAEAAVRALHDANFSPEDISIVVHDTGIADYARGDIGAGIVEDPGVIMSEEHQGPGGISVGSVGLIVPDVGIVIGGPLAVALSEEGTDIAGLGGALSRLGISEDEARGYQERYDAGDVLVLVHAGTREQEARRVLEDRSTWTYRDELRRIEPPSTQA